MDLAALGLDIVAIVGLVVLGLAVVAIDGPSSIRIRYCCNC